MKHFSQVDITSLHVVPFRSLLEQDAAFRGMERVLKNLPEVKKQQIVTNAPANSSLSMSRQFDLIVMGASARPADEVTSIGPVAERIMTESRLRRHRRQDETPSTQSWRVKRQVKQPSRCSWISGLQKTPSMRMSSRI